MRNVFIFVGVCVGICGLALCAFFGYFVWQEMSRPEWERGLAEAGKMEQVDPKKAIEQYKAVCAKFEKQNLKETDAWTDYGNFLWSAFDFAGAEKVYQQGEKYANKIGRKGDEAWYLERQAACQHELVMNGQLEKPDIKLVEKAIATLPADTTNFGWYQARNLETLAQLQLDLGDYKSADGNFDKAVEGYRAAKDERMAVDALNWKMDSLLRQNRGNDANKLFIRTWRDHGSASEDDGPAFDVCENFREKISDADLRDAGIYPQVRKLIHAGDFAALDKMATEFRESRKTLSTGRWYLDALYSEINSLERDQFDDAWIARIDQLKEWSKKSPESVTAKIALVHVLRGYAWKARGSGWANSVSEDGWRVMGERMNEAETVLNSVETKTPDWYSAAQLVALGQSWSNKKYDRMMQECQLKYPDYDSVILAKSYWLQPRWNGEEGDAEKFVESEAAKRSTVDGDILYGRCCLWLDRQLGDVFGETKLQWPRTKKGLLALRGKYPKSYALSGETSILAMEKNDMDTATKAFEP